MDVPNDTGPIMPLPPIAPPPPTAQETIEVLGDADIVERIATAGNLSLSETERLARVSREVGTAARTANGREMARLGADPRVQQVAHFVRERMRQPLVRSGLIPGIDYATLLGPAHTDVERLTQAVGTAADVPADQLRADLLDRRWLALRTDDPRATRPHLIDRLGRPIMRDRAIEGVPDDVQGPIDYRREPFAQFPGAAPPVRPLRDRRFVPRTPLNYLARRGIQVVDRDGFVLNPLPPQAQPPPPPQAQPPPVVAPPMPAFGANVAPAA
jgi:hypothetical protein